MKDGKTAGKDGVKFELFKSLGESKQMTEVIISGLRRTTDTGNIPEGLKNSLTTIVSKVTKLKVQE